MRGTTIIKAYESPEFVDRECKIPVQEGDLWIALATGDVNYYRDSRWNSAGYSIHSGITAMEYPGRDPFEGGPATATA